MPRVATKDGAVDLESLAAADPDLVVLWSADIDDKDTAAIEGSLGVPVYGVFLDAFDDLTKLTADMARHRGRPGARRGGRRPDRGRDGGHHRRLVRHPGGGAAKPSTGCGVDVFRARPARMSTANELIDAAGGINVIETWDDPAKSQETVELSMETIAAARPRGHLHVVQP